MALQARQLAHTQRMRTPWHSPTVLPARAALRWQASGGASTPVAPAERTVQFAVEMSCGACVTAVRNALSRVDGVNTVSVDLASQTADVFGSASVESLEAALRAARRRARLIGQGVATAFGPELAASLGLDMRTLQQSLAAVAEFKGREFGQGDAVGVVRFVQVSDAATRVEASFSGLAPGARHCLAVHSFGDLTRGALSTGPVFSPDGAPAEAGFVCDFTTDASGDATVDSAALNAAIQASALSQATPRLFALIRTAAANGGCLRPRGAARRTGERGAASAGVGHHRARAGRTQRRTACRRHRDRWRGDRAVSSGGNQRREARMRVRRYVGRGPGW